MSSFPNDNNRNKYIYICNNGTSGLINLDRHTFRVLPIMWNSNNRCGTLCWVVVVALAVLSLTNVRDIYRFAAAFYVTAETSAFTGHNNYRHTNIYRITSSTHNLKSPVLLPTILGCTSEGNNRYNMLIVRASCRCSCCGSVHNKQRLSCLQNEATTRLFQSKRDDEVNDDTFDTDAVRQRLNKLFSPNDNTKTENGTMEDLLRRASFCHNDHEMMLAFPPPPLTSIERDRRLAEIACLQQLGSTNNNNNKDDARILASLWMLWYSERGRTAKETLERTDTLLNDPRQWSDCEQLLCQLIQKHGPYFTEPLNRLATLYYLQGRYDASYTLCRLVLHNKPWHVGALSGMVMVCLARNDRLDATSWAKRRLPTKDPSNARQRDEWVSWAVQKAEQTLVQAQQYTTASFGQPEDYYKNNSNSNKEQDDKNNLLNLEQEDDDDVDTTWQ